MAINELAGKPLPRSRLVTFNQMLNAYYLRQNKKYSPIKNGTSGYRGLTGFDESKNEITFSEPQVACMTQALADIIKERGTFGPDLSPEIRRKLGVKEGSRVNTIVIGKDVRFTSDFAQKTVAEVFAANGFTVIIQEKDRSTPTPVISHYILKKNKMGGNIEGVIATASHNPPEEGGVKSNGLNGGPNTRTGPIDEKANYYMEKDNYSQVKQIRYEEAVFQRMITEKDLITPYVKDLGSVVDMEAIKDGGLFVAAPLGGSASGIYEMINKEYNTNIFVPSPEPDPTGAKRTCDHDGKLRGDPSSKPVMKALKGIREKLNAGAVFANDNDADRFGAEDSTGILSPNQILCVVFDYLCSHRRFSPGMGIGRSIATTHMLDAIASFYKRPVYEVNVGFKYYVDGLLEGKYVLAGEESGGLSLPRMDGSVWVTEKDGIAANLLMMEIIAKTGIDIGTLYGNLVQIYGAYQFERVDSPATTETKARLAALAANEGEVKRILEGKRIAGKSIKSLKIGDGIKVVLEGGIWVLFRASGTEAKTKVYKEECGQSLETATEAAKQLGHYLGL